MERAKLEEKIDQFQHEENKVIQRIKRKEFNKKIGQNGSGKKNSVMK